MEQRIADQYTALLALVKALPGCSHHCYGTAIGYEQKGGTLIGRKLYGGDREHFCDFHRPTGSQTRVVMFDYQAQATEWNRLMRPMGFRSGL